MRHVLALGIVSAASLLLASCHSSQPTSPIASEGAASSFTSTRVSRADGADLLAGFHIAVDPETLTTSVTSHRTASAQPPQGQRYDLDIANFQNADSFRVTGVEVLGSGNFRVTFSHAHPFPAPNLANPASGTNRTDLGYSGRLLILTSYNPKSFFGGDVRLSAGAVVSPDGYVEAGDLLTNAAPGLVTAYPYKLLADESQDNRIGVSNGDNPEGSYVAAAGGWQRINIGAAGTGWTGFDYVHGGQTVTNQFVLSKESLAASNFALDVALLIQYQDPRGAGGSTFRFPPTVIDPLQFAYRLPYAALDCSRVIPTSNVTLTPEVGNSTTLEVRVRDWDANATDAADSKVGDEADVALVQVGGSGAPEVVLDAPGILVGLRNMGVPGAQTGWSDSPLLYSNVLPNQEGALAGTYYACLRVTDPESDDAARIDYHSGVDATTLLPDAARAVPARTWQIVPITVGPEVPVITSVSPTGIVGGVDERITFSATSTGDPSSWSWDFGGGTVPNISTFATPQVQLGSVIGTYQGSVVATNAGGDSAEFAFSYRILPPQVPGWQHHQLDEITSASTDTGKHRTLILYQGNPLLLMSPAWTGGPVRVARALLPNPTRSSDWVIHDAIPGEARFPAPFEFDGRLAIAYQHEVDLNRTQAVAISQGPVPVDSSDWDVFDIYDPAGTAGLRCQGIDFNGRMVIVYAGQTPDEIGCLVSTSSNPTSAASFNWHQVAADADFPSLAIVTGDANDDRLLIGYSDKAMDTMSMRQSVPEFPAATVDWALVYNYGYTFEPQPIDVVTYEPVPGRKGAIAAYIEQEESVVTIMATSGYSSMGHQSVSQLYSIPGDVSGNEIALVYLNDRPAILTAYSRTMQLYRAQSPYPVQQDWHTSNIYPGGNVISSTMVASDNAFVVLIDEFIDGGRSYGILTSTGPW